MVLSTAAIISFIIGLLGVSIVLYSVSRMKQIISYRKKSRLWRLFVNPNDDEIVVFRFIKFMRNTEIPTLKKKCLNIFILYCLGIVAFLSAIVYVILNE